jgi:hypothetical protein
MKDVPDAANDVAQSLFFEINLPAELFFESATVLVETVDLRQIVAMLVPARAVVAWVTLAFFPKGLRLRRGLGHIAIQRQDAGGSALILDRAVLRRHGIEVG